MYVSTPLGIAHNSMVLDSMKNKVNDISIVFIMN